MISMFLVWLSVVILVDYLLVEWKTSWQSLSYWKRLLNQCH